MTGERSKAAEAMARARVEFTEAMARGVTIAELRLLKAKERTAELMRQRENDQRWAARRRTNSDEPWMMRD